MIPNENFSECQPILIQKVMLILCWILTLLISGVEVREINLSGCSHVEPQIWYRAINGEEFVLQCALPGRDATNIYNSSLLDQHKVKWFWHQKDKETLMAVKESSNLTFQGDALWFKPIRDSASGVYICKIWGKIPCLKIVLDVQTKKAAKCSGYDTNMLYLLAGSGNSITCPGTKCYSHIKKPDVKWYKDGHQIKYRKSRPSLKLKQNEIYLNPTYDKDAGIYVCDYTLPDNITKWTVRTAVTVEVTAKNTIHPPNLLYPNGVVILEVEVGKALELQCRVQFGFETVSPVRVTWKRNNEENVNEKLNQETSVCSEGLKGHTLLHIATLKEVTEKDLRSNFTCFAENSVGNATAVIQLKRKQRVLFLYILCSAISTLFALVLCTAFIYQHWIEIVLMYRSYLVHNKSTEAYTDDVVSAMKQSRRVIIILSPAYVSGPSIFELQAAVNCALEDKGIKLVLIKFLDFQEPETLPPVVKKALRILPVVTWKSSSSAAPHKKFWKYMRYHMPVKSTKRLENCSLKGLSQRLFRLVY
ncbi:interleukin-18 receptor accessory protein isoform X2 [Oenanthe melanoleuca]|uniref:interleukin-18 receptor accessory protein isoform X2 n=1 Tax=Oenanthe melanoleuca TaxID=2939378 RepID=UPI0024C1A122|nr:interleukin-18 receptor accessory protein isoform X2 [Oenanthe melanoleuca]